MATFTQLIDAVEERLDENTTTSVFYTNDEIKNAINRGLRLFCLLTLVNEKVAQTFNLSANTNFYDISSQFSDFLVPLRVKAGNSRVLPVQSHELDLRFGNWEATTGTATHYTMKGLYLFGVYPKPAGAGSTLSITYAAEPATLSAGSDVPEIPAEFHQYLIDYAIYRLRWKEGGQELAKSLTFFDKFIGAAKKCNAIVRARSIAQAYDRVPYDLESFDVSRLLEFPKLQNIPLRKIQKEKPKSA